ncbi:MAG: hypothetical protein AB1568_05000 [Thermodesulfobacteriota bacterium]
MKKLVAVLVGLVVLVMAAGMVVQWKRLRDSRAEIVDLSDTVSKLEAKNNNLQQKYREQKAVADGYLRARQAAEAKAAQLTAAISGLEEEKATLQAAVDQAQSEASASADTERQKLAVAVEEKEKLAAAVAAAKVETDGLRRELAAGDARQKTLEDKKAEALARLESTDARLEKCAENNIKLSEIAEELAELYEKKGTVASMFEEEPLIKYRQVQVEKLLQDYDERIEKMQFSLH